MISEQQFILLLQKHSEGDCTDEEIQLIDHYLENRHATVDTDLSTENLAASTFNKLTSSIDRFEMERTKRKLLWRNAIKIAAGILLISSAGLLLRRYNNSLYNGITPITYTSVEAKGGHNTTARLPDGSVITLNQNSKLTYSNRFNGDLREVFLTGEAYFQVAKNKNKPFIVHTGKLSTRVLGTSFNIEAYPFSKIVAVELITGKVWLSSAETNKQPVNFVLMPNQAVTYNRASGTAEMHNVSNAETYSAWKDGKVKFSDTRMDEVVRRLNITFNTRIVLADPALAMQRFYGQFGVHEQPIAIIKALCILVKARYQMKPGGEINIYRDTPQ